MTTNRQAALKALDDYGFAGTGIEIDDAKDVIAALDDLGWLSEPGARRDDGEIDYRGGWVK